MSGGAQTADSITGANSRKFSTHRARAFSGSSASPFVMARVELTFPSGGKYPFKFTTAVRVTPDTLPYALPKRGAVTAP